MTSTAEILKAARKLIEKPENWTQGKMASNRAGLPTTVEKGNCFCSLGSVLKVMYSRPEFDQFGFDEAKLFLAQQAGMSVSRFNDTHQHSEVLDLFSKAIAAAEASS